MKFEVGKTYREKMTCEGETFYRYYYISKRSENGYIWVKTHKDLIKDKCRKVALYKGSEYFKSIYDNCLVFREYVEEI